MVDLRSPLYGVLTAIRGKDKRLTASRSATEEIVVEVSTTTHTLRLTLKPDGYYCLEGAEGLWGDEDKQWMTFDAGRVDHTIRVEGEVHAEA